MCLTDSSFSERRTVIQLFSGNNSLQTSLSLLNNQANILKNADVGSIDNTFSFVIMKSSSVSSLTDSSSSERRIVIQLFSGNKSIETSLSLLNNQANILINVDLEALDNTFSVVIMKSNSVLPLIDSTFLKDAPLSSI